MTSPISVRLTTLLKAWARGDKDAIDELMPLVYEELRRMARHYMSAEQAGHTLGATVLVHETVLRLIEGVAVDWNDRNHFFAVSARIMRRVLVDVARARAAEKRGGAAARVSLSDVPEPAESPHFDLIALDEALETLAKFDARKAKVVELRFFGGLSVEEVADVLNVSPETVRRDWRLARAWMQRELVTRKPGD
jgi:RNA polymerase sigma factor (TIGR02999 family)